MALRAPIGARIILYVSHVGIMERTMNTERIKVWDLPVRGFHWLLFLLIVGAIVTGKVGGGAIEWHGRIGLAIIGLLTTVVVINVLPMQSRAQVQKAEADIALIEQGLEFWRIDMGRYPTPEEGLAVLTAPAPNRRRR